ncbi:type II toxin-antitoxin system CcdA family antitoxin [Pontibaca salina]|uniref:Type II toxin-antitoxin system CcdA family antitoxin n=1 Tax=Pontibaca salina TaxID=2795731 RepID=A0A934HSU2_9RHOB|nr:type II toxin-antitoxin system CcdA family antitoxin [Pontibaca salina]MBI6630772.1 type II toxin-antitoxin system CcdA family antitoxin [Pontibaca salina]
MMLATKRKNALALDAAALGGAKALGVDVSAVAEAALIKAVAEAQHEKWLAVNADAFASQAHWYTRHGHPLAAIMTAPGGSSWKI